MIEPKAIAARRQVQRQYKSVVVGEKGSPVKDIIAVSLYLRKF